MEGDNNQKNNKSILANIKCGYVFSKIDDFLSSDGTNTPDLCRYNKSLLRKMDISVFLKRCCWIDYLEKILGSSGKHDDLTYKLFEIVFDEDMLQLEKNLRDKSEEEKEKFHFDNATGKIDEVFKPVLKAYLLQDVLFDLFSIDETDIRRLDFVENGWRGLNPNSPDLFKKVVTHIVTSKEKQDKRLEQLSEIITQPNKKITIKTFDEHNKRNKNFAPEEKRNLRYQVQLTKCFQKIRSDISAQLITFTDNINTAQSELYEIVQHKRVLQNKLNEERAVSFSARDKVAKLKNSLRKLYKCKNLLSSNSAKLPFKIKFKKNIKYTYGKSVRKYNVIIKYDDIDAIDIGEDVADNQQNLSNIDLEGMSLKDLNNRKTELQKILIGYVAELDLEYDFNLEQVIRLDRYTEQDLSKYDQTMQKQIKDMINLVLDCFITDRELFMIKNQMNKLMAQQRCQDIENQLEDFDTHNSIRVSELKKTVQTNQSKHKLFDYLWDRFDGIDYNDFNLFRADLISKIADLFGLNATYLNKYEMLWLCNYISNCYEHQFGHFGMCFDDGIFKYCEHIRDKYYNSGTQTQEKRWLIINQLGIVIAKHPEVNFDNGKVIKMLERVFFFDSDIGECKKHYDDMFIFLKTTLICFAITAVLFGFGYVLSIQLFELNLLLVTFLSLSSLSVFGILIGIFGLIYNLSVYFPEIHEYQSYKKSFAQRRKNFYDHTNTTQYKTLYDFKKNVENQKQLLGLYMKYGEKVPAQTENAHMIIDLPESNNIY